MNFRTESEFAFGKALESFIYSTSWLDGGELLEIVLSDDAGRTRLPFEIDRSRFAGVLAWLRPAHALGWLAEAREENETSNRLVWFDV